MMQQELHCHRMLHILCFDSKQFEISALQRVHNMPSPGFVALEIVEVFKNRFTKISINRFNKRLNINEYVLMYTFYLFKKVFLHLLNVDLFCESIFCYLFIFLVARDGHP